MKIYGVVIVAALALGGLPSSAGAQQLLPLGVHVHGTPVASLPLRTAAMQAADAPASKAEHVAWGAAFGAIIGGVAGAIADQSDHTGEGFNSTVMVGAGALLGACIGALIGFAMPTN